MSLFIGLLAFPEDVAIQNGVKIGVLLGSAVSAVLGTALLYLGYPKPKSASLAGDRRADILHKDSIS